MSSHETPLWDADESELEDEDSSPRESFDPELAAHIDFSLKKLGEEIAEMKRAME